jgi:F-type H+-transporting ATPase subunit b
MDVILHQLAGLFVASIPTVILFLLLLVAYRILVYGPLTKLLAERRERTLGSVEKASAAVQTADAKSQEYEARLRSARLELGRQRELRLQQWNSERDHLLEAARHAAGEQMKDAKISLEQQASAAKAGLEANADQLAAQILQAILPAASREGAR